MTNGVRSVEVFKNPENGVRVEFWVVDESPMDRMDKNSSKDRPVELFRQITEKVLKDIGIDYTNIVWIWDNEPYFTVSSNTNKIISITVDLK